MDKLLVLFVAVLTMLATGCSNELAPEMPKEENVPTVKGKVRSADEAAGIALKAKGKVSGKESRSTYGVKSVECVGVPSSRSEASTDSLFYIVNFDDNEGYAIVGADRRVDDVLAVIDEGSFDSNDIEPNSPRELMYNLVKDFAMGQLLSSPGIEITPDPLQYADWYTDVIYKKSEKMLRTQWKENGIYAKYAESLYIQRPNSDEYIMIGCAPLALGMVMSYYEHPKQITITFDGSNTVLNPNWKLMNGYDLGEGLSTLWGDGQEEIAKEHLALFLREIAQVMGAYGERSGYVVVNETKIPTVLRQFGYTCDNVTGLDSNNKLTLLPSKTDNRMVICVASRYPIGFNPSLDDDWGVEPIDNVHYHAFVFDGFAEILIRKGIRTYEVNGSHWTLISDVVESETEKNFVHINWGWGGNDNGLYNVEMFLQTNDWIMDKDVLVTYEPQTMQALRFYSVSR